MRHWHLGTCLFWYLFGLLQKALKAYRSHSGQKNTPKVEKMVGKQIRKIECPQACSKTCDLAKRFFAIAIFWDAKSRPRHEGLRGQTCGNCGQFFCRSSKHPFSPPSLGLETQMWRTDNFVTPQFHLAFSKADKSKPNANMTLSSVFQPLLGSLFNPLDPGAKAGLFGEHRPNDCCKGSLTRAANPRQNIPLAQEHFVFDNQISKEKQRIKRCELVHSRLRMVLRMK